MPDISVGTSMPSRYVPRSRTYSNVTFDSSTGLMVAAATLMSKFGLFDEDGNRMWEPDGMWGAFIETIVLAATQVYEHVLATNVDYPTSESSTLELCTSDFNHTFDG